MRANDAGAGRGNEVIAAIVPLVVEDEEARRAAAVLRAGRRDLGDQRLQELRLARAKVANDPDVRSEEHTSELQSLMRISYAVFCLKKKQQEHSNSRSDK